MSSRRLLEHDVPVELVNLIYPECVFVRVLKKEDTNAAVKEICNFGLEVEKREEKLRSEVQSRCVTLEQKTQYGSLCMDLAAWMAVFKGYVCALNLSCNDEMLVMQAFEKMEHIRRYLTSLETFLNPGQSKAA